MLASGCMPRATTPIVKSCFLLDTVVSITLYDTDDQALLDDAFALCEHYELVFSRTDPHSELYRLNHAETMPAPVSAELWTVVERALFYARQTGGAYDPTVGAVVDLWDFTASEPALPAPDALQKALATVGWEKVVLAENTIDRPPGTKLDLGGIAKGYIADQIGDFLEEQGVTSALIDLGGNIVAVGSKPGGKPFSIGIQQPFQERNVTADTVEVQDASVVSAGIYERSFTLDGKLYHHILDPATGYPAESELAGVTVIAPRSIDADALSTSLFLLGREQGEALAARVGARAIFIDA